MFTTILREEPTESVKEKPFKPHFLIPEYNDPTKYPQETINLAKKRFKQIMKRIAKYTPDEANSVGFHI